MNVMGIIFANDAPIGEISNKRTMGSLPFGGRYRQIDFPLSNMASAGIRHIGIISRQHYQSLMNHIGSGEEWNLEIGEGNLEFLTPFSMSDYHSYRGKLENLYYAMDFLNSGPDDEYVVMSDASVLSNVDFVKVLKAHIASARDITVVTKSGIANGIKPLDLAIKLGENGEVADIAADYAAPAEYLASMDIFVMSKRLLCHQVKECIAHNRYHMDRDFVMGLWQAGIVTVNVYPFEGIAMFNESTLEYYQNSLSILDTEVRHNIFGGNHPIFTKVRDRVPTYYGECSSIDHCIVADGCVLEGNVHGSVLFRQVRIKEGANVESCLIMNDTVVGEDSELKYVILDKNVVVRAGSKLIGTPNNPIVIKRGEVV